MFLMKVFTGIGISFNRTDNADEQDGHRFGTDCTAAQSVSVFAVDAANQSASMEEIMSSAGSLSNMVEEHLFMILQISGK